MKITHLSLANFRGFEQIDFNFEPDINVIAGVNGVGKSGVLHALAVMLSRAIQEFTPSQSKPRSFEDGDILEGKAALETSAILEVAGHQCYMGIQRLRGGGETGDIHNTFWRSKAEAEANPKSFGELLSSRTLTGELGEAHSETARTLKKLATRRNQPVALFFSPRRQLPGRPRTLPESKPLSVENAYSFGLHDREVELRDFMHWFRVQQKGRGSGASKRRRVIANLKRVVSNFIPEFQDLRLKEHPNLRFEVDKSGVTLALHQLSDGERGMLAMIFDITRRLAIANPLLDDPISEGEAIVLIDEIELHLHPKWQREVLHRFRNTFKKCQFIVTSHSPQILGEVKSRGVRFLLREQGNKVVRWIPPHSFGWDSNRVLVELMKGDSRNAEIKAELSDLFKQIDLEKFRVAQKLIAKIEATLGKNDPELTRARSLIAFLKGEE